MGFPLRFPDNVIFDPQRNRKSFILTFQHSSFCPKNRSVGTPVLQEGFVKVLLVKDSRNLHGSKKGHGRGKGTVWIFKPPEDYSLAEQSNIPK